MSHTHTIIVWFLLQLADGDADFVPFFMIENLHFLIFDLKEKGRVFCIGVRMANKLRDIIS